MNRKKMINVLRDINNIPRNCDNCNNMDKDDFDCSVCWYDDNDLWEYKDSYIEKLIDKIIKECKT